MTQTIKENLKSIFSSFYHESLDYLGIIFYNIYSFSPDCFKIYIDNNLEIKTVVGYDYFKNISKSINNKIDTRYFLTHVKEKIKCDIVTLTNSHFLIVGDNTEIPFLINVLINTHEEHDSDEYFEIYCKKDMLENIIDLVKTCIRPAKRQSVLDFGIATANASNIYTAYYDYEPKNIDIEKNYNDDFGVVYDKICDIIDTENETGLILLYGEPGTGKSSVIKNLISEFPDTDFVFVDGSLLAGVQQNTLISYFIENQNTVFILEDCEKILMSREEGFNPIINTLLNITDGIIGDVLGIKLICTFNTSLSKIDKALLRKGRLSVKYEFKKLKANKVSKILGKEVKEDMTLADIYNFNDENDFSKEKNKKVGFNQ